MVFIGSLFITIISVFIGTIIELVQIDTLDKLGANSLYYDILPESLQISKTWYLIGMYSILVVIFPFLFGITLLFYIQVKNFWLNRTTNERFSKKKPTK